MNNYSDYKNIKICYVVPVYIDKILYMEKLYFSMYDTNDLYLIFSFHEDFLYFKKKLNISFKYLILENNLSKNIINKLINNFGIVSFKKLFAVNILIDYYDYILALDDDFLIIDQNLITDCCHNFKQDKIIIAGNSGDEGTKLINFTSMKLLKNDKNFYKILKLVNNYFWLNEIPIYEKKTAQYFLNFIDFNNNFEYYANIFNFYFFDTLIYNYFLILNCDYNLTIINMYHSIEFCSSETWNFINKNKRKLNLINYSIYDSQNVAMVFHTDRVCKLST